MVSLRNRNYSIILYIKEVELLRILRHYSVRINHYAYIVHDKDTYKEDLQDKQGNYIHRVGEIEKVHIHLLVSFYNAMTPTAVIKLFTTENDKPKVEITGDICSQFRYLTHKDDKDKFQYDDCAVISNDINYYLQVELQGHKSDIDSKAENIINDILRNVSPRIMVARYGRDYVIHMNQYNECAKAILEYDFVHRQVDVKPTYETCQYEIESPFDED